MLTDALLSEETGAVTLASRSVSAEAALYGVSSAVEGAAAFHPGDERQQQLLPARRVPWRTAISLRVKRTLSTLHIVITSPTLATLAIGNVITLAVHTLVMTMWQSLLEDVSPGEQWNGSISAAAYAISAIFVAIISAQRIDKYVSRCTVAVQAVYALVLAAATWGMALSRSFELVVVSLVVYHVCAEMLLVTGSASIARIAVRVAARRNEYLPMPTGDADDAHSKSGASRRAGDAEEMPGSLPSTTAAAAVDSVAHGSMYGFITFISQLLQIAVQLGFGPQGLQFSLQRRFAVYAALCTLCCLLMAAMAVPLRCGRAR
ncbi:MAG: hypothetical protein EOO41_01655 [Methanobacteriota archaeon]|nr:MAG: hypothetical protein EOO41_01655 [Euryarchaeota archaeon]